MNRVYCGLTVKTLNLLLIPKPTVPKIERTGIKMLMIPELTTKFEPTELKGTKILIIPQPTTTKALLYYQYYYNVMFIFPEKITINVLLNKSN